LNSIHFWAKYAKGRTALFPRGQSINDRRPPTKVNAILNCHLCTGPRIGQRGICAQHFSRHGQAERHGEGAEVGRAGQHVGQSVLSWEMPHIAMPCAFLGEPHRSATRPGLKAVDMFQACADGRDQACGSLSTNPAVSLPERTGRAAICECPFCRHLGNIHGKTDTNDLADVLLPCHGMGEKDGTVNQNSSGRFSGQRAPFSPGHGLARPGLEIIQRTWRA